MPQSLQDIFSQATSAIKDNGAVDPSQMGGLNLNSGPTFAPLDKLREGDIWEIQNVKSKFSQLDEVYRERTAAVEANRNLRFLDVDVEALRNSGDLEKDRTIIPRRVIHGNTITNNAPRELYIKTHVFYAMRIGKSLSINF